MLAPSNSQLNSKKPKKNSKPLLLSDIRIEMPDGFTC
ncbi:hypothetical protein Pvag_pPag20224 (plasmid) [Pantoea vagans C9-1]|nr:hypothetical protein Pvag_pPag20224 [Pantoea vagans C9-1]